ncbi:Ig-like domain-containing protein [Halotia wernerae UHCC 0503]|nr:Ig-like domain-containing protein [Halotia wernerae UHCC 0503]
MTNKALIQPLDRIAIALMLLLSLLIGFMILQGDVVAARVRDFTWQNQQIGSEDISFTLNFSRPMDTKSVEDNLKIEPPLAGKVSWAGRRMVYTLLTPAPYGTNYKVQLQGAKDKFSEQEGKNRVMQPFLGNFHTRDRVISYIGADPENQGQLVVYNLTEEQKRTLTPKDLVVMDFKPFPNGEKILFSARAANNQDLLSAQLYTVTTGIPGGSEKPAKPAGKVDLILDNKNYQNLKFDLSPDGETIVVQRGSKANPGDFGLWFMPVISDKSTQKPTPQRLQSQPGGDFMITPDSKAVAVAQGQGAAILPLQGDANKPLDFLPQFGLVEAFSKDGSQAAMVKFNTDYTRDLFLVTNQGIQKPLLKTTGSIIDCQFDPASPTLYCLLTQLVSKAEYVEQPYLVAIDLKTGDQKPLLVLPIEQRNVQMSLSPDGLGLLFDQVIPQTDSTASSAAKVLKTDDGDAIASSSLWLMPLLPIADAAITTIRPEKLPLVGFHPRWLP